MRLLIASVFGYMAVMPVFAAGLPIVNVGGVGVSARSAFGDVVSKPVQNVVSVEPTRRVVARRPNQNVNIARNNQDAAGDVLSPNLPSSNLWAESAMGRNVESPLRMPNANEFAVLHNDIDLPDEKLDASPSYEREFAIDTPRVDNDAVAMAQFNRDLESTMKRMAEIDAQIEKISELQRRANDSVRQNSIAQKSDTNVSRKFVPISEPDVLVRSVEKHRVEKKHVDDGLAGLSPTELRKAFRKTFLSENKHLSAMADDEPSDTTVSMAQGGFSTESNLSEMNSGIRPFEIKVSFRNFDSALSRENYTLLTTFGGIVVNDPKRAVQILIPQGATTDTDNRKLTARRLAIVEQVLRDAGVPEQRIMPVLSNRDDDGGLVLRNIDSTQYETLTKQQRNQFGKVSSKTYKSMTW